jgi:hypothetical protein
LSAEQIRELESSVRKSKVVQEEAARSLEDFDRKIAELFANREMSYKEHSKLITRISAPSHQVLDENNLPSQLDDIVRFANVRATAPLFAIDETLRSKEWIDLLVVLKDLGFSLNTLFEKPLPSVDIVGTRTREQSISKAIDNLLFTYTPFKLRGARREDYTILLLPSIRGDSIARTWFSNETNCFYEDGVKVITPDEVRPTSINEIRDLIYVNGEQYFRLEIDRRIRDGAYYCRMGQYISPLRNCNRHECWLWSACNGKRFWSRAPRSFYSIAKVSPNIEVKVDNYKKPEELLRFRNIFALEKIDELLAKIYISSVTFMSRYMIRHPLIALKETIGYRVNTKSIALAINASWLKGFVKALLLRDSALYTWMYTKYFIWNNFDVNDVRRISRFFWNLIISKKDDEIKRFERGLQSKSVSEDLVTFACKVLLHTIAHVMHEEIVAILQTASDNIVYAYSQNQETDGNFRIFLFENAERGLGLTESFASRICEGKEKIVTDMIDEMVERTRSCSMGIAPSAFVEGASENVKTILNRLDLYNRVLNTSYGISIPVEIARYILTREDQTTSKLIDKEDVSAFVDDMLSTMPLCWDGCYQCVRLETDCHEPPYEQMFLVSKLLLTALLNEWRGTFAEPVTAPTQIVISELPVVEIGEARKLFNFIASAKESVRLTSPWISEKVARAICILAEEKKVNFYILTSLDVSVETHKNALRIFMKSKVPGVHVKVIKDKLLHAKLFLIDESLLIVGSANLTLSGLYENVESYVVLSNKDVVAESLTRFQELWDVANSLENIDMEFAE